MTEINTDSIKHYDFRHLKAVFLNHKQDVHVWVQLLHFIIFQHNSILLQYTSLAENTQNTAWYYNKKQFMYFKIYYPNGLRYDWIQLIC